MLQTVVNKTCKMHNIDNILHAKFEATSVTIEKTLQFKDAEEGELLAEIFRDETRISKLEARIKVLNEFLLHHDVNALEVLHEGQCYMDFGTEGWDKSFMLCYPETGELDFTIKARDLLHCNIKTTREIGSKEDKELWRSWQGDFEHTSLQNSGLHIRFMLPRLTGTRLKLCRSVRNVRGSRENYRCLLNIITTMLGRVKE